jgi:hypothetical protein
MATKKRGTTGTTSSRGRKKAPGTKESCLYGLRSPLLTANKANRQEQDTKDTSVLLLLPRTFFVDHQCNMQMSGQFIRPRPGQARPGHPSCSASPARGRRQEKKDVLTKNPSSFLCFVGDFVSRLSALPERDKQLHTSYSRTLYFLFFHGSSQTQVWPRPSRLT